jgi:purine-binding chemotaxis protein CheW
MTLNRHSQMMLLHAGTQLCAIPIGMVAEVMRPLPTQRLEMAPSFVSGMTIYRGSPVPVVVLQRLLDAAHDGTVSRFIALHIGSRTVMLAVSDIVGIRLVDESSLGNLPPLLDGGAHEPLAALAVRDEEVLLALNLARLLPADFLDGVAAGSR